MGRLGVMSKKAKKSLKLPIFLIIGPALGLVLSIFIYAIVNFIFSGVTAEPTSTSDMSLSDGTSIAQGVDGSADLYGDSSMVRTISNVLLFLLGSVSVLAFVPCLVFGIIILNRRRNSQGDDTPMTKNKESRDWGDLE